MVHISYTGHAWIASCMLSPSKAEPFKKTEYDAIIKKYIDIEKKTIRRLLLN